MLNRTPRSTSSGGRWASPGTRARVHGQLVQQPEGAPMAPAGVAADRLDTKRTIDLRPPGPGGGSARGKRTTPISARMRLVTTCARRAEHASVPCNKGQRDELEPVRRRLSAACGTNEGHGLAEALSRSVEPPVEQHGRGSTVGRCACAGFGVVERVATRFVCFGPDWCRHTVAIRPWSRTAVAG
jgi:hypothetical protein